MASVDRRWSTKHLHQNVGRSLGWLPLLQKFGVLSKKQDGDSGRGFNLKFGGEGEYKLLPLCNDMVRTFQDIERFELVMRLYGTARDFTEYERILTRVREAGVGFVFEDPDGYIRRWTFRAEQMAQRHAAGCLHDFHVPQRCTVERFQAAFPDQKGHLMSWATHLGIQRVHALAARVGYHGSLFWFTMYLCLLLHSDILTIDPEVLRSPEFARAVGKIRHPTRDQSGSHGLPAAICKDAAHVCI